MARQLRVTQAAERQIAEASAWWVENRSSAPELFGVELRRGFELVTSEPGVGAPCVDAGFEGVRRLHLWRIRYHVYYRLRADDVVEVLALWHTARGEGPPLSSTV